MSKHSRVLSIITASFAVSALLLTACASNKEGSTPPAAGGTSGGGSASSAAVAKVDSIAALVPDKIKSSGKLIVGVNLPYTPNEFKDSSGKIVGFDVGEQALPSHERHAGGSPEAGPKIALVG